MRTAVVTGASRGIGRVVARELADRGMRVIAVQRSEAGEVESVCGDLSRMAEVRRIAGTIRDRVPRPDLLINNAAVFENERTRTGEGLDTTFAVNQMAPFLLTRELAPKRVVNVSSEAHRQARFDLRDLQAERRFRGMTAYANSKLAMILFAAELTRRGTAAIAMHPGVVDTTLLAGYRQGLPRVARWLMPLLRPFFVSAQRAAAGVARLALDPAFERQAGSYYAGGRVRAPAVAAQSDATALVWFEALARLT